MRGARLWTLTDSLTGRLSLLRGGGWFLLELRPPAGRLGRLLARLRQVHQALDRGAQAAKVELGAPVLVPLQPAVALHDEGSRLLDLAAGEQRAAKARDGVKGGPLLGLELAAPGHLLAED